MKAEFSHVRPHSFPLCGEPSAGPLFRLELIPDPLWTRMAPSDTLNRFMVWSDEPGRFLLSRQAPLDQRRSGTLQNWLIGAVWFKNGFELCLHSSRYVVLLNDELVQPPENTPWEYPCAPLRDGDRLIFEQFGLEYAVSIRPADEQERSLRDAELSQFIAPVIHRGLATPWYEAPWMMSVARLLEAMQGPDSVELCILVRQEQCSGQEQDWECAPQFVPVLRQRWGRRGGILREVHSIWAECPVSYESSRYDVRQFFRVANVLSMGKRRDIPAITAHFRLTYRFLIATDYLRASVGELPPFDHGSHRDLGTTLVPSDANETSVSECSEALMEWVSGWMAPQVDIAAPSLCTVIDVS